MKIHFPVEDVENNVRTFLQTVREAMAPEDEVFAARKKAGAYLTQFALLRVAPRCSHEDFSVASTVLQVYLSSTRGPGIELSDVGYTPYK